MGRRYAMDTCAGYPLGGGIWSAKSRGPIGWSNSQPFRLVARPVRPIARRAKSALDQ
jgi:hypothetical protein